jgi:hypothetical protein
MQVAANLRGTFIEYGIQLGPESEFAIEWLEPGFHGPVVCRGRPDNLHRGFTQDPAQYAHTAFDLKKIKSADPETCSRHIYEYGYDIQRAAYTSAISKLLGVEPELVDFVFVFMEIEPPYAVNPVRLDETLTVMGERRWQRAVGLWEHCSRENRWPSYTRGITTIEAPLYAIKKEESTYGSL